MGRGPILAFGGQGFEGPLRRPGTPVLLAPPRPVPLTQAAFSERFGIPLTCQRDWEQGRSEPPEASASYLTAILNDHVAVAAAFNGVST